MRKMFLLVLSLFLVGCGWHAEIEQKVDIDDFFGCTYSVKTYVVYKKIGFEYMYEVYTSFRKKGLEKSEVIAEKERQYKLALPHYRHLSVIIKDNDCLKSLEEFNKGGN